MKERKNTIKDTPKYDPDAQVTGLTYTIPSWVNAIDRVAMNTDTKNISDTARAKLVTALSALIEVAEVLIELISEKDETGGPYRA